MADLPVVGGATTARTTPYMLRHWAAAHKRPQIASCRRRAPRSACRTPMVRGSAQRRPPRRNLTDSVMDRGGRTSGAPRCAWSQPAVWGAADAQLLRQPGADPATSRGRCRAWGRLQKAANHWASHAGQNMMIIARRPAGARPDKPAEMAIPDRIARTAVACIARTAFYFPAGEVVRRMPAVDRQQDQQLNHHAHRHLAPSLLVTLDGFCGNAQGRTEFGLGPAHLLPYPLYHVRP